MGLKRRKTVMVLVAAPGEQPAGQAWPWPAPAAGAESPEVQTPNVQPAEIGLDDPPAPAGVVR